MFIGPKLTSWIAGTIMGGLFIWVSYEVYLDVPNFDYHLVKIGEES